MMCRRKVRVPCWNAVQEKVRVSWWNAMQEKGEGVQVECCAGGR